MKRILLIAFALIWTVAIAPSSADAARRPTLVAVKAKSAKVWVPRHSTWNIKLGRYVTVTGKWKTPPRPGMRWVSGHRAGHNHRRWVSGHWSARRS